MCIERIPQSIDHILYFKDGFTFNCITVASISVKLFLFICLTEAQP